MEVKDSDTEVLLYIKLSDLGFFVSTFSLDKYGVKIKSISLFCSSLIFINMQGDNWIAFNNNVKQKTTKNMEIRPILNDLCFLIRSDFK